jgi:Raf kinase inhibitor-like YbhB/YbcL family protein
MRIGPAALAVLLLAGCGGKEPEVAGPSAPETIAVHSPAFADQGDIPQKYTCDGQDVSPPLTFGTLPPGTAEVALLVEDPDAPGGTFVHWVAWGITPGSTSSGSAGPGSTSSGSAGPGGGGLGEGEAPAGAGTNGFGRRGYGGPCPPKGAPHRYVFTVYALSAPLNLPQGASANEFKRAIGSLVLARGTLVGRYARG